MSRDCPHCDGAGVVETFDVWIYRVVAFSAIATGVIYGLRGLLWLIERIVNG